MADSPAPPRYCLTLICPPTVEEKVLDLLLSQAHGEVFTSTPTRSHGGPHERLGADEQVMGRSLATQVNLLLSAEQWGELRAVLQHEFAGVGLRYWATPLALDGAFA